MARNVYTYQIVIAEITSATPYSSGPPPDGYVWIIDDITAIAGGAQYVRQEGFKVFLDTGLGPYIPIWDVSPCVGGIHYHWRGRSVVTGIEQLYISVGGPETWNVIVTGYELSLP